jgi:hypothetical protein
MRLSQKRRNGLIDVFCLHGHKKHTAWAYNTSVSETQTELHAKTVASSVLLINLQQLTISGPSKLGKSRAKMKDLEIHQHEARRT